MVVIDKRDALGMVPGTQSGSVRGIFKMPIAEVAKEQ